MRAPTLVMAWALASPIEFKVLEVEDRGREMKSTFRIRRGTKALAQSFGHDDGEFGKATACRRTDRGDGWRRPIRM